MTAHAHFFAASLLLLPPQHFPFFFCWASYSMATGAWVSLMKLVPCWLSSSS